MPDKNQLGSASCAGRGVNASFTEIGLTDSCKGGEWLGAENSGCGSINKQGNGKGVDVYGLGCGNGRKDCSGFDSAQNNMQITYSVTYT